MELDDQLQAMYDRQAAEYQRRYVRSPRAQAETPETEQEPEAEAGREAEI